MIIEPTNQRAVELLSASTRNWAISALALGAFYGVVTLLIIAYYNISPDTRALAPLSGSSFTLRTVIFDAVLAISASNIISALILLSGNTSGVVALKNTAIVAIIMLTATHSYDLYLTAQQDYMSRQNMFLEILSMPFMYVTCMLPVIAEFAYNICLYRHMSHRLRVEGITNAELPVIERSKSSTRKWAIAVVVYGAYTALAMIFNLWNQWYMWNVTFHQSPQLAAYLNSQHALEGTHRAIVFGVIRLILSAALIAGGVKTLKLAGGVKLIKYSAVAAIVACLTSLAFYVSSGSMLKYWHRLVSNDDLHAFLTNLYGGAPVTYSIQLAFLDLAPV